MTRRERILAKSQELFNKNGIRKVSVRSICDELNISLGNFTYYFPDKQQIIIELYDKMISETEVIDKELTLDKDRITFFLEYHRHVFKIQNKFKFFFLNTFELINQSTEIRKAYLAHIEKEKRKMKKLLLEFRSNGVLKADTDTQFLERLIDVSLLVNSFWIIDAELHFKGRENKKLIRYLKLCCSLIEPHLTSKAKKEYDAYFNNYKKLLS